MLDDFNRSGASASGQPWPVAVVDVSLRSGEAGLALVRRLRVRYPQLKLIAVGNHDDALAGISALEAGANGFVPVTWWRGVTGSWSGSGRAGWARSTAPTT